MRASPQQLFSFKRGRGPVYLQIYQRVRTLILTGAWPPGTRLPSSRSLARDLGISRTTALLALDELTADGWIIARPGSGIYVSADTPPTRSAVTGDFTAASAEEASNKPVPFNIAEPAVDVFPLGKWAKMQSAVWSRHSEHALHEGSDAGWQPLRVAIASYLHAVRGLRCTPDQIIVLSSSQAAIYLCARVLGTAGDAVWIENPGYPHAREAFHSVGMRQVPVPVDEQGMDIEVALALERNAALAYLSPACQFPTGVTLSEDRAARLLSWASASGMILEDDWDFNARFDGAQPSEPLAARLPERVIHIHSFNRLLFPALRIAAVVVPERLIASFREVRRAIDRFPNIANQIALTEFIDNGHLSAHLRTLRDTHLARREALRSGLAEHASDIMCFDDKRGGLHAVAWLHQGRDSDISLQARRAGIACGSISEHTINPRPEHGALLLGFAAFQPDVLHRAVPRLAEFFRSLT